MWREARREVKKQTKIKKGASRGEEADLLTTNDLARCVDNWTIKIRIVLLEDSLHPTNNFVNCAMSRGIKNKIVP